jgi:hypothetical protein
VNCVDLPDEVWQHIFEIRFEVPSPKSGRDYWGLSEEALVYAQVCHRWKVRVSRYDGVSQLRMCRTWQYPLCTGTISFRSLETVERATQAIPQSVQANKISQWTQTLVFDAPPWSVDAFSRCAATIVTYVRQPVDLYLEGFAASGSRLATTVAMMAASRSTLTLAFGTNANLVFAQIGSFVNVRALTLVGKLDWEDHWPTMPTSSWEPWTSPTLMRFSLKLDEIKSYGHAQEILRFVQKCEMANLAEFRLSLPFGMRYSVSFRYWQGLVPEVWQNCPKLTLCGLSALPVVTVEVISHMAYPTIELDVGNVHSLELARHLPEQVQKVVLVGTLASESYAMKTLVDFLDDILLYSDSSEESQLTHIRLDFELDLTMGGHTFSWRGGHSGLDQCIAQLISYDVRLREQRIFMLDSDNKTRARFELYRVSVKSLLSTLEKEPLTYLSCTREKWNDPSQRYCAGSWEIQGKRIHHD